MTLDFEERGPVPDMELPLETGELIPATPVGKRFVVTPVGIAFQPGMPFEEWERLGEWLRLVEGGRLWFWGDWLAYGEGEYHELMAQALEESDYKHGTLATAKWVCSRIPLHRRRPELSFTAHQRVAALPPDEQDALLDLAIRQGLTSRDLGQLVKAKELPAPSAIGPTAPPAAPSEPEPPMADSAPGDSEIGRPSVAQGVVRVETAITKETAEHVAVFVGPRTFETRRRRMLTAWLAERARRRELERQVKMLREQLAYAKTRLRYYGEAS